MEHMYVFKQGKGNQEYEEVKDESRRGKKGSKQTVNSGKEERKQNRKILTTTKKNTRF